MKVPREIASGPNPPPPSRFFKDHPMQPVRSCPTIDIQGSLVSKQANRFPAFAPIYPAQPRVTIPRRPSGGPISPENLPSSLATFTRFGRPPLGTPIRRVPIKHPIGRQDGRPAQRARDSHEAAP